VTTDKSRQETESNLDEVPDAVLCEKLVVGKRHMGNFRLLYSTNRLNLCKRSIRAGTCKSVQKHFVDGQGPYESFTYVRRRYEHAP
jgi:hypothetical protein